MNSVQENKNELEAAVRYCESAISRAKATIESMEFRQQAASKAWHEQTGREAALEREVTRLKGIIAEGNNIIDEGKDDRETLVKKVAELKTQLVEERDRSMVYTNEIAKLNDQVEELGKAYNDEIHETNVWKKAHRELKEVNNLQKEQIEMFQRKMSRMNEVSNRSVLDRE